MRLDILYCCDNNYAPYCGVSMVSLLENNADADNITVYVVSDHISEENLDKMREQVRSYGPGRELKIIDGVQYIQHLREMNVMPYRGSNAYCLRLFFTSFIGPEVRRLLYLDCDTIVTSSLQEMFGLKMENEAAAVVLDSLSSGYKELLGFQKEDNYFNSGMILFDVCNWKKHHCDEKLRELMGDPNNHYPNTDQDFLNLLLRDIKLVIGPQYNFQATHQVYSDKTYFTVYSREGYYSEAELQLAREAPVILHAYRFLGQFPWHKNSMHPWRELFWKYVKISKWQGLQPVENDSLVFAAERLLFRMIPRIAFLPMLKKWQDYSFKKKLQSMRNG